ncbi:MAG: DUF4097 family beta strand repeat-containing protein [Longimicrobiales bacterium]|nr:DUF4097 family beta strand repeat-containing protein [Longimicrobiales bacterium]
MRTLLVLTLTTLLAGGAAAQSADFRWSGRLGADQVLEVRGVNGDVRAVPASGDVVEVTARRYGDRDDPESVRIEVVEHDEGVTLCAVYPTPRDARRENECRPGGGHNNVERNDVRVDFTVRVPTRVRFHGHTVNGAMEVEGLQADVRASTVNGDVDIRTAGLAEANTVNGGITAVLGTSRLRDDVRFETVNGSITLEIPDGLNADFRASTVNGTIDSDFAILVSGKVDPRSLRGTIGDGGPELRLSTVNGSIRIRQR